MRERHSTLSVPADLLSLRSLGPWLQDNLVAAGDTDPTATRSSMELAVQEICVNVVKYALADTEAGEILVTFVAEAAGYTVTTQDAGAAYDISTRPKVDLENPTVGGYGLYLVETLCEQMVYERIGHHNVWSMRFARSVPAAT
ncbi:MAG: ATP-binding protein [Actinomycetota bacterium]